MFNPQEARLALLPGNNALRSIQTMKGTLPALLGTLFVPSAFAQSTSRPLGYVVYVQTDASPRKIKPVASKTG